MMRVRAWATGLGLLALLAAVGSAAPGDTKDKGRPKGGLGATLDRLTRLLPPDPDNKLKLTDDQKKQVDQLQGEFGDKSKDAVAAVKDEYAKNRDAIRKARQDKDRAALKQAMAPVREKVRDVIKLRSEYEDKVKDVLNDDQKKTFAELQSAAFSKGPFARLLGKGKKKVAPKEP
jgi:hypothetical protein